MTDLEQFNRIDEQIRKVAKQIKPIKYTNPLNADEQKELFLSGSIKNLGEYTAVNIEIIATYYDDREYVVAANYVDIHPEFNYLNPNQTKEFVSKQIINYQ